MEMNKYLFQPVQVKIYGENEKWHKINQNLVAIYQ